MVAAKQEETFINRNLISLKIVIFFSFLGFSGIHLLNSILPFYLGLNFDEYRLITIITPLISIIGPLIIGPLTDHLAGKNPTNFGRCLRILTAICLIITIICYTTLIFTPASRRHVERRPGLSFGCDLDGGVIFQETCDTESKCHNWDKKYGDLILTNCSYICQNPQNPQKNDNIENSAWQQQIVEPSSQQLNYQQEPDYSDEDENLNIHKNLKRRKRFTHKKDLKNENYNFNYKMKKRNIEEIPVNKVYLEPPHICETKEIPDPRDNLTKCHVYTEHSKELKMHVTLRGIKSDNKTQSDRWCNYPLDRFQCNIPQRQIDFMESSARSRNCKPMIACEIINPYDSKKSVLADTLCIKIIGNPDLTITTYFILRPIGSIFLLAALALLNTAIVIATRETSTGRGEICRQYLWAAIGWVILLPTVLLYKDDIYNIHLFDYNVAADMYEYLIVLNIIILVSLAIAAILLLISNQMPLSPPEWWWHTKTGMLVYPMSAIRKYSPELLALSLITFILGTFWGSIHNYYIPWLYKDYYGLTYLSIIFLLFLLFNIDKFIEYCSHSNILITIFALYIIRFIGLQLNPEDSTLTIIMEILEPLYVTIGWVTCILYMRHIISRKYTATGQATLVAYHFCLGKCIGALVGFEMDDRRPENNNYIYHNLAIIACVLSFVYFTVYNLILAPRCAAQSQQRPPQLTTTMAAAAPSPPGSGGLQTNGTNGNYTPLRVYHNERGKKGQFRY